LSKVAARDARIAAAVIDIQISSADFLRSAPALRPVGLLLFAGPQQ
jgi:hypothetical protein